MREEIRGGAGCRLPSPERIREARERLEESRRNNPGGPITEEDILRALDDSVLDYFITTSLYWDCQCPGDGYHRPADMPMCEACEAFRDESADSRINELRHAGIHLDLDDPGVRATLEGHGPRMEHLRLRMSSQTMERTWAGEPGNPHPETTGAGTRTAEPGS